MKVCAYIKKELKTEEFSFEGIINATLVSINSFLGLGLPDFGQPTLSRCRIFDEMTSTFTLSIL